MNKIRKMKRERLEKCLRILSLLYPVEEILNLSPFEVEKKTFDFLSSESPLIDKYMEKWNETRKNKRDDKKVSQTEV